MEIQKDLTGASGVPAEAELAESYSVNRLTVRMALQKLQTIGLIEAGKYNPTLSLCLAICKTLDKTLDQLFWE